MSTLSGTFKDLAFHPGWMTTARIHRINVVCSPTTCLLYEIQIANVGFHDVTQAAVGMAVERDTLFVHGSSGGGGGTNNNNAVVRANGKGPGLASECTSACGRADTHDGIAGMSTFCDLSCLTGWSSAGPRFSGHGCGANDSSRYGKACRQCYTSKEAALAEDQRLSSPENIGSNSGMHVVMCSTGNPPPASECSDECMATVDAVRLCFVGKTQRRCSGFYRLPNGCYSEKLGSVPTTKPFVL